MPSRTKKQTSNSTKFQLEKVIHFSVPAKIWEQVFSTFCDETGNRNKGSSSFLVADKRPEDAVEFFRHLAQVAPGGAKSFYTRVVKVILMAGTWARLNRFDKYAQVTAMFTIETEWIPKLPRKD